MTAAIAGTAATERGIVECRSSLGRAVPTTTTRATFLQAYVARHGQHRAQHLQRLRVAVGGEELLRRHGRAVRRREVLAQRESVVSVAPLGAVLQELG